MRPKIYVRMSKQAPGVSQRDQTENHGRNPQTSSLRVHAPHFLTPNFALSAKIGGTSSVSSDEWLGYGSSPEGSRLHRDSDGDQGHEENGRARCRQDDGLPDQIRADQGRHDD